MARAIRNNNARRSRNWGKMSGVTISTNPGTSSSGVSLYAKTVESDYGYVPWYGTNAKTMVMGVLDCTGTSKDRQDLGLTTIDFCVASGSSVRTAVTPIVVTVDSNKAGFAPGTGVTEVCFHVWRTADAGSAFPSPCSIQYFAIGTA